MPTDQPDNKSVRDTLYVQLRNTAAGGRLAYALTGAQPGAGVQVEQAAPENILALAPGRKLVLFVPGFDVRLSSVQVPARQPQKVLQAAPYALEDQLAEDVETLHFAIAFNPRGGPHPVAIAARSRMDAWLGWLRAKGVKPDAVVPETLALPLPEAGRWTALVDTGRVTVRTGAYTGFSCALEDLESYLQLADPAAQVPLRLFLPRGVEHDFTRLQRPLELMPAYGSALEVLVRHYRVESAINLLQGAYSQNEDWQRLVQPWRSAGIVAAAWAGVALAGAGVQTYRLGLELREQAQKNIARYQELFPGETRIVNLAAQAGQQLATLRGGVRAPLFQLLDVLSTALSANAGLALQSLQFREGALFLDLTGNDVQALENLRGWFAARRDAALEVLDTNAGAEGLQIRLRLTLTA